nr:crocetin glucosyltransferase, chloroplastic-like [Ipomoea batatas]
MGDGCHVLLVLHPASQGQVNPCLQFAKRLVNLGVKVTLSTTLYVINRISNHPAIPGIDFAPFSDGYDDGYGKVTPDVYGAIYNSMKTRGSEYLANLVRAKAADGAPFTRIIYTTLMQWVGEVARSLEVPATLLWIQPATVLDIYYCYFTDCQDLFKSCGENGVVQIPGLPALGPTDFPTFMFSKTTNNVRGWAIQSMKDQIDLINSEENPKILVNTFDELEVDALRAIKKMTLIGIGPLVPSAYLDGKDPSDTSFGGDLREKSDDYIEWLDSQPKGSVVYIAFGSYANLPTTMVEQIAQALVESRMPFLWVLRETANGEKPEEKLSCKEELEKQGQGQINPCLQFAKRLVNLGVRVTFSTTLFAIRRISTRSTIPGIDFAPFSDGYDDGYKGTSDGFCHLYDSVKARGSEYVASLVKAKAEEGAPFTRIIFTTLMAWVGEVARSLQVPATLLWTQPATVLDIYYYYFSGYQDLFRSCGGNGVVEFPGLPPLAPTDFPSFMFSKSTTNVLDWAIQGMKDQIDLINSEESPKILVNTFDDLEVDALRAIKKLTLIGIGPLVPSAYLDGKDPSDTSFGGDLLEKSDDYVEWLDSQPKGSVIYVAFGSYSDLPNAMMEEIGQGLIQSKMTFLWLIQDVWKIGMRVKANEEGIVEACELKRCIGCVMGEEGAELRKNAMKWRELAKSSMKEYGSSNLNLKAYVNDVLL